MCYRCIFSNNYPQLNNKNNKLLNILAYYYFIKISFNKNKIFIILSSMVSCEGSMVPKLFDSNYNRYYTSV